MALINIFGFDLFNKFSERFFYVFFQWLVGTYEPTITEETSTSKMSYTSRSLFTNTGRFAIERNSSRTAPLFYIANKLETRWDRICLHSIIWAERAVFVRRLTWEFTCKNYGSSYYIGRSKRFQLKFVVFSYRADANKVSKFGHFSFGHLTVSIIIVSSVACSNKNIDTDKPES